MRLRSATLFISFLQDRFCSGSSLWNICHIGTPSLQPCRHDFAKRGGIWSQLTYCGRPFWEVNIIDLTIYNNGKYHHNVLNQNQFEILHSGWWRWGTVPLWCCCISGVDLFSTMFPIDFCWQTGTECLYTHAINSENGSFVWQWAMTFSTAFSVSVYTAFCSMLFLHRVTTSLQTSALKSTATWCNYWNRLFSPQTLLCTLSKCSFIMSHRLQYLIRKKRTWKLAFYWGMEE